jgi:hypothetical protein
MGVSLHCACGGQHTHSFVALHPRECVDTPTAGCLIHCLRILREPDEEVTPDSVTIKLLVAAWPESANISSSIR